MFSTSATSTAGSRSRAALAFGSAVRGDAALLGLLTAAATVFYLAPWPLLSLPALLAVAALSWYRLDLGLLLVVLFAPTFMVPKLLGGKQFPMSELLLALETLVALGWVLRGRLELRWARLTRSPFLWPALLLLLAATLSSVLAIDHAEAFRRWRQAVVEPLVLAGLLSLVERDAYRWRWVLGAVILTGVGMAIVALIQLPLGANLTYATGSAIPRVKALYGSPDNLGLLFDRSLPLWFALVLLPGLRLGRRLLLWLAGIVLLAALLFTFSRGAWFAIAVAVVAILLALRRIPRLAMVVGLAVVVLLGLVGGGKIVHAINSGHSQTVQRRLEIWRSSLRMIRDHPLVGVGPDNFLRYYAPVHQAYAPCKGKGYMEPAAAAEPCLSHPHDEFLDFWLSTGLLGLVSFLWLEVAFWRSSFQLLPKQDRVGRVWLVGVMGAMLAALLHGLVDNSYFLPDLAIFFWVMAGYVSFLRTAPLEGT